MLTQAQQLLSVKKENEKGIKLWREVIFWVG